MKTLTVIFLALAIYGFATDRNEGVGLLALGMAVFMVYGARQLNKRDAEFLASTASAEVIPDTQEVLREQGSEGTRSTF